MIEMNNMSHLSAAPDIISISKKEKEFHQN